MIAYSRGSKRLAGAAPLEHRMPAMIWAFRTPLGCSSVVEQQPDKLCVAGSTPAIRLLLQTAGTHE